MGRLAQLGQTIFSSVADTIQIVSWFGVSTATAISALIMIIGYLENIPPFYLSLSTVGCGGMILWIYKNRIGNHKIDGLALANEAEQLSKKISELIGEHKERQKVARELDSIAMREAAKTGHYDHTNSRMETAANEGRLIRRFNDLYAVDFRRILTVAQRCIALDYNKMWRLQHGLESSFDIESLVILLIDIASRLRFSQPALPMYNDPRNSPK